VHNSYQVLGVPNFADVEACREAYNKRYGELFSSESPLASIPKLQELKAAFEMLTDEARKSVYDEELRQFLGAVEVRFANALAALEQRDLETAIAELRACIQLDPRDPSHYEALGVALQLQGNLEEARKIFMQGLSLVPKEPRFNSYLGDLYRVLHDAERSESYFIEAVEELNNRLKSAPDDIDSLELLADIYTKIGWYDEALSVFEKMLELFPYHAEYHRDLGILLYSMGRIDEAEIHVKESLADQPQDAVLHLYLGLVYFQQRLLGQAIDELETSVQLNPDQAAVVQLLEKVREVKTAVGQTVEEIVKEGTPDAFVEGEVKWYDAESGLGVLTCPEFPQVLLHFTALPANLVETLKRGDLLRFGVVKDTAGAVAVQVTAIGGEEPIDTQMGTVVRFDPERRFGVVKTPADQEYVFTADALSVDILPHLAVGIEVVFDVVADKALDDQPMRRAMNLRQRKTPPWKKTPAS